MSNNNKSKNKSRHLATRVRDIMDMEVPEIIEKTTKSAVETLTGLVKSNPQYLLVSLGSIAQRIIAGQKLDSVRIEWEKLKEKGKIKNDYARSLQAKYTLLELLKFLEGEMPDEDRFQALKKILLVAATEEKSDRNSIKPQQFMQLIKSLSSGCVLVLVTTYKLCKAPPFHGDGNGTGYEHDWLEAIANNSGLGQLELVANFEDILMQKRLITPRVYKDGSGVKLRPYFRLTNLAYEICQFIEHYDTLGVND